MAREKYFSFLMYFLIGLLSAGASSLGAEGFGAGTLVKTPHGYTAIENLGVGDRVWCCDKQGQLWTSYVAAVRAVKVAQCVALTFNQETVLTDAEQLFRLAEAAGGSCIRWSTLPGLWPREALSGVAGKIEPRNISVHDSVGHEPPVLYSLSVAGEHTYLVTQQDVIVHNFVLVLPLVSLAFGSGGGAAAIASGKLLCDFLLAGLFLTAVEWVYPGSTSNYEYKASGPMYQIQGQGSERGNFYQGNVDERCRPVPTPAEEAEARSQAVQVEIQREARRIYHDENRANWTPREALWNWLVKSPNWWKKKIWGKQEQEVVEIEVPALAVTPRLHTPALFEEHPVFQEQSLPLSAAADQAMPDDFLEKYFSNFTLPGEQGKIDPLFKKYLRQQAYESLYAVEHPVSQEHLLAQIRLAQALYDLHQVEMKHNAGEALLGGYHDLATALAQQVGADLAKTDAQAVKRAVVTAEFCGALCDRQLIEAAFTLDGIPIDPSKRIEIPQTNFLERTGELIQQKAQEIASNPLPFLGNMVLCAAAPQLALAAFVLELAIYHNEILDNADRFKQLLRYNMPEAMAQLTTLCGELLVFHKGLQAARGGGQVALQRYAKALENLSSVAAEEMQLVLVKRSKQLQLLYSS